MRIPKFLFSKPLLSTGVSMFVLLFKLFCSMLITPQIKVVSLYSIAKKYIRGYTLTTFIFRKINRNITWVSNNTQIVNNVRFRGVCVC